MCTSRGATQLTAEPMRARCKPISFHPSATSLVHLLLRAVTAICLSTLSLTSSGHFSSLWELYKSERIGPIGHSSWIIVLESHILYHTSLQTQRKEIIMEATDAMNCCICASANTTRMVTYACSHRICDTCHYTMTMMSVTSRTPTVACGQCRAEYPVNTHMDLDLTRLLLLYMVQLSHFFGVSAQLLVSCLFIKM